jgi:hypothetical protein
MEITTLGKSNQGEIADFLIYTQIQDLEFMSEALNVDMQPIIHQTGQYSHHNDMSLNHPYINEVLSKKDKPNLKVKYVGKRALNDYD